MYFQIVHIIVIIYVIFNVKVISNIILTLLFLIYLLTYMKLKFSNFLFNVPQIQWKP